MKWEKAFKEASLDGVPFKWIDTDGEVGQRLVKHLFPKRAIVYNEPMGKMARVYNINALVIGDNYQAERDALLDVCEKEGIKTLVHPTLPGEIKVVCGPCPWGESTRESGMAWFQLTLEEAGEARYPSAAVDGQSLMTTAASAATSTFGSFFSSLYNISGPSFLLDSVMQDLSSALGTMKSAWGNLPQLSSAFTAIQAALGVGDDLVSAVTGAISGVADLGYSVESILSVTDFDSALSHIPSITTTRIRQAANRTLTSGLVKQFAVVEAIRAAAAADFDSYDEAMRIRGLLLAELESQTIAAGDNGDDDLYTALVDLRTEVSKGMRAKGASLARVVYVDPPPDPMPSLVWAYQRYEDLSRAEDITARNAVKHPGFMTQGDALELLSV